MSWWKIAYSIAVLTGAFHGSDAFLSPRRRSQGASSSSSAAFIKSSSAAERSYLCKNNDGNSIRAREREFMSLQVGSTGWDNDNFLDALSKGDDALNKANEQYKKYSRFSNMRPAGDDDEEEFDIENAVDKISDSVDVAEGTQGATLSKDQVEKIKLQNEEESGGGEMFKKLLERAQQGGAKPPPPTLAEPPPPPQPPSTAPALPEGFEKLSVEAQAALFRQLMATPADTPPQQWPPAPGPRPEAKGQARAGEDGRRIGRNRDAEAMVNTSDVYFSQLKLDSAVRNKARYNGEFEKAEAVFADPAIKEIKLHVNPFMEEQRKKELEMVETAVDEMLTPEILGSLQKPVNIHDRGVSYKELLEQKRKAAGQATPNTKPSSPAPSPPTSESAAVVDPPLVPPVAPERPATSSSTTVSPTPKRDVSFDPPEPAEPSIDQPSEDATRRDIRTLMGLLIKHRGGPGFGAGRIVGAEMERFAALASDVVSTLRTEAPSVKMDIPLEPANTSSSAREALLATDRAVAYAPDGVSGASQNSYPQFSGAITQAPRVPAADRINSVLACIEGAITMYKNAPPELQNSVLVTLRSALLSAVSTCNEIVVANEVEEFEAYRTALSDPRTRNTNLPSSYGSSTSPKQYFDVIPEKSDIVQSSRSVDDESEGFLESVYQKLKDAAGDGKMGLRADLDPAKAEELANDISRMRAILVNELTGDTSRSDASAASQPPAAAQYKQMLAKVRADKDAAGGN
jgi:hypothetical protein